jgi:hypothetical protein
MIETMKKSIESGRRIADDVFELKEERQGAIGNRRICVIRWAEGNNMRA